MKIIVLVLAAFVLCSTCWAQEPVFLNHRIGLTYRQYQYGESDEIASTDCSYTFEVGAPVLTYRLGSVSFLGALQFSRLRLGDETSSDFGLNRYGVSSHLFPYRRLQFLIRYLHSRSPSFFQEESSLSNNIGLEGTFLGSKKIPKLRFGFQRSTDSLLERTDAWNIWRLSGSHRMSKTYYTFQAYHQRFNGFLGNEFSSSLFNAYTNTVLSRNWQLHTRSGLQAGSGTTGYDVSGSANGQWDRWSTSSSMDIFVNDSGESASTLFSFQQGAAFSWPKVSLYSSGTVFRSSNYFQEESATGLAVTSGAVYRFARNWSVAGDVSIAQRSGVFLSNQESTTFHTGIFRGGELPDLIRRSVFFLSEMGFNSKIEQQYPPGYVPPELAAQLAERRSRQGGAMGFSAEYWNTQLERSGNQHWLRATGDLRLNARFNGLVIGDWKKDSDYPAPGILRDQKSVLANAGYSFGRSSVSGSINLIRLNDTGTNVLVPVLDSASYSVGFYSRFWRLPYGVLFQRYSSALEPVTHSVSVYTSLDFRYVGLRAAYDIGRRADGFRSHRLTLDVFRFFDTIFLRGYPGRR